MTGILLKKTQLKIEKKNKNFKKFLWLKYCWMDMIQNWTKKSWPATRGECQNLADKTCEKNLGQQLTWDRCHNLANKTWEKNLAQQLTWGECHNLADKTWKKKKNIWLKYCWKDMIQNWTKKSWPATHLRWVPQLYGTPQKMFWSLIHTQNKIGMSLPAFPYVRKK